MARIRHLADAGNWSEAVTAAEQGLKRHPLEPAAYYIYALIAEHGGSMAEAEDALGRAVYLDRSQAVVHYHLGRCQLRRGDRRAAQTSFDNARSEERRVGKECVSTFSSRWTAAH